jgi:hypothetical protein
MTEVIEALKDKRQLLRQERQQLTKAWALVDPTAAEQATLDRLTQEIDAARAEQHKAESAAFKAAQKADVDPAIEAVGGGLADAIKEMRTLAPELVENGVSLGDLGWHDHAAQYSRIYKYPNHLHKTLTRFSVLARQYCLLQGHGARKNKFQELPEFVALWRNLGAELPDDLWAE